MDDHAWYVRLYADLYQRIYRKDTTAGDTYLELVKGLNRRLPRLHHVLDTYIAKLMTQHAIAMQGLPFDDQIVVKE